MTWNLELTRLILLSHTLCIVLYNVFSSIDAKNRRILSNFAITITDVAKILSHFLLWKVCNRLKLSLCMCYFSLWEEDIVQIDFCLIALFIQDRFFLANGARTFNMDETDSNVCRPLVYYSSSKQIQLTKLIHICISKLLYI